MDFDKISLGLCEDVPLETAFAFLLTCLPPQSYRSYIISLGQSCQLLLSPKIQLKSETYGFQVIFSARKSPSTLSSFLLLNF